MNIKNIISKIIKLKDLILVFSFSLFLFLIIIYLLKENTDLPAHVVIARKMYMDGKLFSGNFLMYLLVNVLSFFSGNINLMNNVLCVILAVSTTAKFYIVKQYLGGFMNKLKAVIVSISLLIIYIVPFFYFLKIFGIFQNTNNMYLGYYVPNVWHNSTIIFLFPFAILLYLLSNKQLIKFDIKRNYMISILVVINVFIKPSFFFAFIIAYPLMILSKFGLKRLISYIFLPALSGLLSLLIVYSTIYNSNDGSSVAITFENIINIDFWLINGKYLITSLSFPILFLIVYSKKTLKDIEFYYLLCLIISSIGIYYMCVEIGPRATHGNFYWQIVISMWLVFLYISKILFSTTNDSVLSLKQSIVGIVYVFHVIMGIGYISKILITQNFG